MLALAFALAMQVELLLFMIIDKTLFPASVAAKMNTSLTGVNSLINCTQYHNYVLAEGLAYDNTLASIENFFGCSGICVKSTFFSLTDIS